MMQLIVAQNDKLAELASVDFVASHLRKHGVAPYLVDSTIEQRVNEDVAAVMKILGCDKQTAQHFVIQRTVGSEPTVNAVQDDGGSDSGSDA